MKFQSHNQSKMKFLVLTVLLISFFIGIYYFYSKYEVIKKGNKYKPDKTEIVFRGPCDGILRLAGKGNYIKRAAENMLQTTFTDDEIKEIKRLTKLPKNIQPLDTDVSLAMRVAYFFLYCLKKDLRFFPFDYYVLHKPFDDYYGAYKQGLCSDHAYYCYQIMNSIGFDCAIVAPVGHTAMAFRLGTSLIVLDATFNVVAYVEDPQNLDKNRINMAEYYVSSSGLPLARFPIDDFERIYRNLSFPFSINDVHFNNDQVCVPVLEGLPIELNESSSLILDYSGAEAPYVLAKFIFTFEEIPHTFKHSFLGRMDNINIEAYARFNGRDKQYETADIDSIKIMLLSTPSALNYTIQDTVVVKKDTPIIFPLAPFEEIPETINGKMISFLVDNPVALKLFHETGYHEYTYEDIYNTYCKIELLNSQKETLASEYIYAISALKDIHYKSESNDIPRYIRFTLGGVLDSLTFTPSLPDKEKIELKIISDTNEYYSGINEYLSRSDMYKYVSGQCIIGNRFKVPHTAIIDISPLKECRRVKVTITYRLSSTAFPFLLPFDAGKGKLEFIGSGKKPQILRTNEPLLPYKIEAFVSGSENIGDKKQNFELVSFFIYDAALRPTQQVKVNSPGFFKKLFPIVPLYTKDINNPYLYDTCFPNVNGVVTCIFWNKSDLPKDLTLIDTISGISRKVKVEYQNM